MTGVGGRIGRRGAGRRGAIGVVCVLLAGLWWWTWEWGQPAEGEGAGVSVVQAPLGEEGHVILPPGPRGAAPDHVMQPAEVDAAPVGAAAPPAAAVPAADPEIESDLVPVGPVMVEGLVVDFEQRPLAGESVRIESKRFMARLESQPEQTVLYSDAAGRFRFVAEPGSIWELCALDGDVDPTTGQKRYVAGVESVYVPEDGSLPPPVTLELGRYIQLVVELMDDRGHPVDNAQVVVEPDGVAMGWTSIGGTRVPDQPGRYVVLGVPQCTIKLHVVAGGKRHTVIHDARLGFRHVIVPSAP